MNLFRSPWDFRTHGAIGPPRKPRNLDCTRGVKGSFALSIACWILCFVLVFQTRPAQTEEADALPHSISMTQLFSIIRDISPRFAAIRGRIEIARAEVAGAAVLPNPRITYGRYQLASSRNTMFDGRAQENVLLEIPILIAGQRGARVETAQRRVEAAEAGVEAEFVGLVREAWGLFVKMQAGRERVTVLTQAVEEMTSLHTLVSGREKAGSASPYDVLRIAMELKTVETRLENATADRAATAGELGILLGLPDWRPDALGDFAPLGVSADPGRLWASAQDKNADLAAVHRLEVAADAGLEMARRERWPTPELQVGTAFTDNPYGNTPYAGISVELPIFDRNQGGMARAEAEKQVVQTNRTLLMARTRVELERATELLSRRRESRVRFEQQVLAKLTGLKQMAESAYRLGKGTLLELLDSSRSRTDTRLLHVDLILAETEAELDTLKAAGLLTAPKDASAAAD